MSSTPSLIAGIKLCQSYRREWGCDFISAMPTNLYAGGQLRPEREPCRSGPPGQVPRRQGGRRRNPGHLGDGLRRREFLHVDDLADACVFLMKPIPRRRPSTWGRRRPHDRRIGRRDRVLGRMARTVRPSRGQARRAPRKLLDISKLSALGWRASIPRRSRPGWRRPGTPGFLEEPRPAGERPSGLSGSSPLTALRRGDRRDHLAGAALGLR